MKKIGCSVSRSVLRISESSPGRMFVSPSVGLSLKEVDQAIPQKPRGYSATLTNEQSTVNLKGIEMNSPY